MRELQALLFIHEAKHNRFPNDLASLSPLLSPGHPLEGRGFLDPWGRAYVYVPPTAGSTHIELRCLGEDGRPGGTGANEDIVFRLPVR